MDSSTDFVDGKLLQNRYSLCFVYSKGKKKEATK